MIREATEEDLDALMDIEVACFTGERFSLHFIDDMLARSDTLVCLLTENGRVVGYGAAVFSRRRCHIYSVAVLPENRRHGYGTALVGAIEREAAIRDVDRFVLEVRAGNDAAIGLYRKMEYRVDGEAKGYYNDGENAVVMRKR